MTDNNTAPVLGTAEPVFETESFEIVLPPQEIQAQIQTLLFELGRYLGPSNGEFGISSWTAIQKTVGYEGPSVGYPDQETFNLVREYANELGSSLSAIDGDLDQAIWTAFATALETEKD